LAGSNWEKPKVKGQRARFKETIKGENLMPDEDRRGPRQRSPRPSKPMGGLKRGKCKTKKKK